METGPVCEAAPASVSQMCEGEIPVAMPGNAGGRCEPGEIALQIR